MKFDIFKLGENVAFSYDRSVNVLIQIFDITGRIVKYIMDKSGSYTEVRLSNGFYIVKYLLDGKSGMKKFVIE